ncbi:putative mitochondrial protein [Dendrobium catenatum]|uniref:Putative mitochondrial protein n=1 Tax=Dendrobium catenatum TaxID=906689 RepID=A0A2I0W0W2_9ASPA|nr:putative mitochondrial protein [Dendrobium catenatum]
MEAAQSSKGIFVFPRKYTLDLLKKTSLLGCRPSIIHMDPKKKLGIEKEEVLVDKGRYQRLVEKLIYLSHTHSDIEFVVSMLSQYMSNPMKEQMEAVYQILRYLKNTPQNGYYSRKMKKKF